MEQRPDILIASLSIPLQDKDAFARANVRLDAALNRLPALRRVRTDEGDDLTFYDQDGLRAGLAYVATRDTGFLTLALGPQPGQDRVDPDAPINEVFVRALLQMIAPQADVDTIFWQAFNGTLEADLMDEISITLEEASPQTDTEKFDPDLPLLAAPEIFDPFERQKNDQKCRTLREDDVLADIRAVMVIEEKPSFQMKLSAYALSYAFVIVAPTMGLAMLTYSVLRHVEELANA